MRIHSLWSTRAGAFCAGVLLSLVLTGAILENARANDVPPPPTRVPETLRMQIDSLTAQVGALQTQVGRSRAKSTMSGRPPKPPRNRPAQTSNRYKASSKIIRTPSRCQAR